ncbi:hypothetical protein V1517DRAFT_321099 [Lipomyces orientalis]|uniref:Uncharacterized protein n=1 Tax=Lipomyces orientalis TaxID=1233043 RepID=A0ACC3TQR2_9ASCO
MAHPTIANALAFLNRYPRTKSLWRLGGVAIMGLTGILSRSFLYAFHDVNASGVEQFVRVLEKAKEEGRGVLTVSNHISVVDDPVMWGLLPIRKMFNPTHLRWGLGAENICFTTKLTSNFFSMGQVLATRRFGTGVYQGSVDSAILLLCPSSRDSLPEASSTDAYRFPPSNLPPQWIHIFPESLVHQAYPPHQTSMKYFHWGVSRIILEVEKLPVIVPIFHQGLDDVFPEDRENWKYVPRTVVFPKWKKENRVKLNFKFGAPLGESVFAEEREQWKRLVDTKHDSEESWNLRSMVAARIREAVTDVRKSMGLRDEDPRFKDPYFWSNVSEITGVKIAGKYGNSSVKVVEKEG